MKQCQCPAYTWRTEQKAVMWVTSFIAFGIGIVVGMGIV